MLPVGHYRALWRLVRRIAARRIVCATGADREAAYSQGTSAIHPRASRARVRTPSPLETREVRDPSGTDWHHGAPRSVRLCPLV